MADQRSAPAESPQHLEPFVPVDADLGEGVTIQVHWDSDKRELVVILYGRHCGRLAVVPRSSNSVSIVRIGAGGSETADG